MLTAVIPLAHEVTAESNDAMPSSEAPYPRDVGTAMIGRPIRPAMTEKSDASMPATAMTTSAFSISSTREIRRSTPATPTSGTSDDAMPR
jgi:hypothetical protein